MGVGSKRMIKKSKMVSSRHRAWKWEWQALVVDLKTWSFLVHVIELRKAFGHASWEDKLPE
jgi:hypothetical protein